MLAPTKAILLMFFAYLAGSIPFGFLIALTYGGIDIREHGSKNIGMTNVFRTLGPFPGLMTLLFDALKGFIPVQLTLIWLKPDEFGDDFTMWAVIVCMIAFLAVLGHVYPVWLQYKGGKSVAVSLGIMAALIHGWVLIPLFVFILAVVLTRYVSVGSLLSAVSVPVVFALKKPFPYSGNLSDGIFIGFAVVLMVMVFIRHVANIKRLIKGTENRVGSGKSRRKKRRKDLLSSDDTTGSTGSGTPLAP
jgi:glycerol-3-phosphate acyltransferase PlsY